MVTADRWQLKICGLTRVDQALTITRLGATAIGFICVPSSPRWLEPDRIAVISRALIQAADQAADQGASQGDDRPRLPPIDRVGVFANADLATIAATVAIGQLTIVQLHGDESPEFVAEVRSRLPDCAIWRALRVKSPETLDQAKAYVGLVEVILLDAYRPGVLGGTGATLDWQDLRDWRSPLAWYLAGGLTPENIGQAIDQLGDNQPTGFDLSSGVERSPGDKDLDRVASLIQVLNQHRSD